MYMWVKVVKWYMLATAILTTVQIDAEHAGSASRELLFVTANKLRTYFLDC